MKTVLRFTPHRIWKEEELFLTNLYGNKLRIVTKDKEFSDTFFEKVQNEIRERRTAVAWELNLQDGMDTDGINGMIRSVQVPLIMSEFKQNADGSYVIDRGIPGRPRMVFVRYVRVVQIAYFGNAIRYITSPLHRK